MGFVLIDDRRGPSGASRAKTALVQTALVTAFGLLASGCGGGSDEHYNLGATRTCLDQAGVVVQDDKNLFADGSEGNLAADYGDYDVFLAFGKDSDEADELASGIKVAGKAFGGEDPGDVVFTKGNVLYYVNSEGFLDEAKRQVEGCLTSSANPEAAATAPSKTEPSIEPRRGTSTAEQPVTTDARTNVATGQTATITSTLAAPLELADTVETVRSGVVRVNVRSCGGSGSGTGIIVSPQHVVTVEHVIDGLAKHCHTRACARSSSPSPTRSWPAASPFVHVSHVESIRPSSFWTENSPKQ